MGISARLAEITVLTDEDPRFEESMKILDEMAEGCEKAGAQERITNYELRITDNEHVYFKIPNRKEAIEFIITKLAKKDDIILLCGKGHESSMNYNGKELPWSEHKAVQEALAKL
jgi:UDP-N-acetylmuramoyl-L-alanyl-D-glutamate--2,6-diaminopimelate ligase